MYKTIYVPVDNSNHSNRAIENAVQLGGAFGAKLVGSHVYAAKMHDYRFKQMEYTLPEEYLDEPELERQRKIHDSLITLGLELISDSYLEQMAALCKQVGLEFEPKMMDGKHHVEIVRDIHESDYDLVVIGALGVGRVKDSCIGSVCERVTRDCDRDVWVVKRIPAEEEAPRDTILVGIDGSPQSFGALMTAIEVARKTGKSIECVGVYDPYLHYSVFNGIVGCLTEKAAKVFRFEEQNQLHEEIIDTGLAQIYQSHLDVAEKLAADKGVAVTKTLLDGKAFQKILDHARETNPWLVVIGRVGVHAEEGESGLGSNTENLLRSCPVDLLLTTRLHQPRLDVKAEESIRWTPEAEEKMQRAPRLVRGIARTAVLRLAVEKGHSVITSAVIEDAMERFMPQYTADKTRELAGAIAIERARDGKIAVCAACGVAAKEAEPRRCAVCGATAFETISTEMLERIAEIEGGAQAGTTYDGRKLMWTKDAKAALRAIDDLYKRRRVKARIEKSARAVKLPTISVEFCRKVIEDETGVPLADLMKAAAPAAAPDELDAKVVATDENNNPLRSPYAWAEGAVARIFRVPAGFMRARVQERVERLAWERGDDTIDAPLVEEGIEIGKQMMSDMLSFAEATSPSTAPSPDRRTEKTAKGAAEPPEATKPGLGTAKPPQAEKPACPFQAALEASGTQAQDAAREIAKSGDYRLNEVGVMSEMARKRGAVRSDDA